MLRILLGKRPETFSSTRGEDRCFQSVLPSLQDLSQESKRFSHHSRCLGSIFRFAVTRITGSVPLSRTRTQARSVFTLSPSFVSTDEFFPRILFKPLAILENLPWESFPVYLIPSLIIWYSGTSLTISDTRRPRVSAALRNNSPDKGPSGQLL